MFEPMGLSFVSCLYLQVRKCVNKHLPQSYLCNRAYTMYILVDIHGIEVATT